MNIYIARHCQTNYNVAKLCNGDPGVDVHLSDKGTTQAREPASSLEAKQFDVIYISEFYRTRQTADIINRFHDAQTIVDKRLNDIVTGYEGQSSDIWYDALASSEDPWTARFNDGESLAHMYERVGSFVRELRSKGYSSLLIVAHDAIMQDLYGMAHGLSPVEMMAFHIPQGEFRQITL